MRWLASVAGNALLGVALVVLLLGAGLAVAAVWIMEDMTP